MTWTIFKSGSARGFRLGKLPNGLGLRIDEISSLNGVQPFPDATNETSIYVETKTLRAEEAEFDHVPCYLWRPKRSARLNPRNTLAQVFEEVEIREGTAAPVAGWGSPLWTGGKREYTESKPLRGTSMYIDAAHRGTVSDLARIYWVKVESYSKETGRALIRTLRDDELAKARPVKPVEGAWVEAELLHPLIRGRDLGRYCYQTDGWHQIIPNMHYEKVDSEEEFAERYPCAYSYFANYRDILSNRATYRRYQSHLPFYAIYCVGAYSFEPWKVAWMEQQNPGDFRCAVVSDLASPSTPNRVIVPDHKLYFANARSEREAHFLSGFLNSHPVRAWLGGFLLGKQIGTSIFEFMHVPQFQLGNQSHQRVAEISIAAHRARRGRRQSDPMSDSEERELAELVKQIAASNEI